MDQSPSPWVQGEAYEAYIGRWSRLVAFQFLEWLDIPPGAKWLDLGCGTGVLTGQIVKWCNPSRVFGIDQSAGFISTAKKRVLDSRVRFDVGDAERPPAAHFDIVVSGLVLNFLPDPVAALAAMKAAAPDGVVAAYVWDYVDGMDVIGYFWSAAAALDPAAAQLDEGARFAICRPEPLEALWRQVGLVDVISTGIDIPTVFRTFDEYWTPFLGGQGPAPAYAMSLDVEHRAALRQRLRADLPVADDGSIDLRARAWAVKGSTSRR